MFLTFLNKHKDLGLLVVRIGLGLAFLLIHGLPKLQGGPERWQALGASMSTLGITFAPQFWGFLSAFVETAAGVVLIFGLFYRPFLPLLIINMIVAVASNIGGQWLKVAYPLEMLIFGFLLFMLGPGKYSLDNLFFKKA